MPSEATPTSSDRGAMEPSYLVERFLDGYRDLARELNVPVTRGSVRGALALLAQQHRGTAAPKTLTRSGRARRVVAPSWATLHVSERKVSSGRVMMTAVTLPSLSR